MQHCEFFDLSVEIQIVQHFLGGVMKVRPVTFPSPPLNTALHLRMHYGCRHTNKDIPASYLALKSDQRSQTSAENSAATWPTQRI